MNDFSVRMVRLKLSGWFFLLLLLLSGCSVEKNTNTSRFYHNLTSLYNVYFNGNESYREGVAKVARNTRDNYSILLPVFDFPHEETPRACASEMERAIQKASKVISLHSITAKPEKKGNKPLTDKEREFYNRKEFNLLIDDSYLLMGKARVYLHEYDKARTTLNYCINESLDEDVRAEARVWLARIQSVTKNYSDAARILKSNEEAGIKGNSTRFLHFSTSADLNIRMERYSEAIADLEKAISHAPNKRTRYRYTYLLAQLYEKSGNLAKASDTFLAVARMNTPYEIEFNARINHAGVFDVTTGNPQEIRKELIKMSKDAKNKEYLDQIYFALGSLSEREGNMDDAVENYLKSVATSVQNNTQKGKSYLSLGTYYYENPGYMEAGKYYDSAAFFLDKNYPDYTSINERSRNLSQLVRQLEVIEREDSLQMVAAMLPHERIALVSNIIDQVRKAEAKEANPEYNDMFNLGEFYENERRFNESGGINEGKWYFYNQSALTFGRTEFRRRWGERKLEDNWRRSVKTRTSIGLGLAEEEESIIAEEQIQGDNKDPEFYLKNLPFTDSMKAISNARIAEAYYESGRIFYELFNDRGKATETFDILLLRFPQHFRVPESLYRMYQILLPADPSRADSYRQRLLSQYPDSEPARLLTDPGYPQRLAEAAKMSDKEYDRVYALYRDGKYIECIALCDAAIKQAANENLVPKYMLLKAYATAAVEGERALMEQLTALVKAKPSSEEAARAKEIMDYMRSAIPEIKVEEDKQIAREIYTHSPDNPHLFAVIIENPLFNINQAVFDVINYNIDNFTNKNYRTEGSLVDKRYILITVGTFPNSAEAMSYYNSFDIRTIIRNPSGNRISAFVISQENLNALREDKDHGRYRIFFEENFNIMPVRR